MIKGHLFNSVGGTRSTFSGQPPSIDSTASAPVRRSSRSRAFLLEMLLNMLVFARCATTALQIFAVSKTEIDQSRALTKLSIQAESWAETFKSVGGQPEDFLQALGSQPGGFGSTLTRYYGADLTEIDDVSYLVLADEFPSPSVNSARTADDPVAYTLSCTIDQQGDFNVATLAAYTGTEQLLSFAVFCYAGDVGAD